MLLIALAALLLTVSPASALTINVAAGFGSFQSFFFTDPFAGIVMTGQTIPLDVIFGPLTPEGPSWSLIAPDLFLADRIPIHATALTRARRVWYGYRGIRARCARAAAYGPDPDDWDRRD